MLVTVKDHLNNCIAEFVENVLHLRSYDIVVKEAFNGKMVITYLDRAVADVYFFRVYDDMLTEYTPCPQTISENSSYCVEDLSGMRYVFYAHDYSVVPNSHLLEDVSYEKESFVHLCRCG